MKILTPYIDRVTDPQYKKYRGFHSGVDIAIDNVLAYAPGVVIDIGEDSRFCIISIQYSTDIVLRYGNLKSINVNIGDTVFESDLIGVANVYVHFEYISREKLDSTWPVRIGRITYFKHNPVSVFDGSLIINQTDWKIVTENIGYFDPTEYIARFSGGRDS